jgi:hypothetical protein
MIVEKQMECRLAGETEVLGENLPQRHYWLRYFGHEINYFSVDHCWLLNIEQQRNPCD